MPCINSGYHRLALGLHRKIDDRGRPAKRRRPSAGKEIIARLRPAKRQLHMRMRIDPAGNDELAAGVDDFIRLDFDRLPNRRDRFAFDKNIGYIVVDGGYYSAGF
jgi:hypothetical protein